VAEVLFHLVQRSTRADQERRAGVPQVVEPRAFVVLAAAIVLRDRAQPRRPTRSPRRPTSTVVPSTFTRSTVSALNSPARSPP
jgi:hypothetical protein